MTRDLPYRRGVGIILFNKNGRVWMGERISKSGEVCSWQFPQGGVDEGEKLEDAAKRELYEETCITSIKFLAFTQTPLVYDFPEKLKHLPIAQQYKGQMQYWFAYLFTGEESEISVNNPPHNLPAEFSQCRWEIFAKAPRLVVGFKQPMYAKLYKIFHPLETDIKRGFF